VKKLIALLFVFGVVFSTVAMTGCGDTKKTDTGKGGSTAKETAK
jgi:hypothetical protein